jgi:hypothetical protein
VCWAIGLRRQQFRVSFAQRAKRPSSSGKSATARVWHWVTFREQSMEISRERRSRHSGKSRGFEK